MIVSPGFALSTAACIESVELTVISAAAPMPEHNVNIKNVNNKSFILFISNSSVYT